LELINEVLDLAKIEVGKHDLLLESVYGGDAIRECMPLTEQLADIFNIQVELTETDDFKKMVYADYTSVKQVLLNLLTNVIKYNRQDGIVTVGCEQVESGNMRIYVSDTGLGIARVNTMKFSSPSISIWSK
jgi:signal transduction histidine kinase